MQCPNCGASVPDDSIFCNRCGKKLSAPATTPAGVSAPGGGPTQPETEVWSGRYSLKAMGAWILLLGLLGLVFLYTYIRLYFTKTESPTWAGWAMLLIFLALGIWLLAVGLMRKLTIRYRLTTQRLFVDKGIIARSIDELELVRVDDVNVHQNIIQRIFKVGDVRIMAPTDPSSPTIEIVGIVNPVEVKEKIRALTYELRKKSLRMEQI